MPTYDDQGGMTVGGSVTGGTASRMLTTDTSGNLSTSGFTTVAASGTIGPVSGTNMRIQNAAGAFSTAAGYVDLNNSTGSIIGYTNNVKTIYDGSTITHITAGIARIAIDVSGNVTTGVASLATTATDGFLYVPSGAGAPTGTPTAKTGYAPVYVDTTNNRWYFYSTGAWRNAGP